jgi:hypothetical protein
MSRCDGSELQRRSQERSNDSGESITPTWNRVAERLAGFDSELEPVLAAMTSRLPGSYCVSWKVNRQAVPCLPGAGVKGLALKQASSPARLADHANVSAVCHPRTV